MSRYNETPGTSFPSKLVSSMKILEEHLVDLEAYAYERIANIHPIDYVDSSLHAGADLAKQSLDQLAQAIKHGAKRLLTIDEIPSDWRNNPHILCGYRFHETKMQCIHSVVRIHNETGNIWTHIVGFFFVLAIGLYWYPRSASYEIATAADKIVVAVFLFAALECLACSTIWHIFSNFANLAAMKRIACFGSIPEKAIVDIRLRWNFSIDCCINIDSRISRILLSTCRTNNIYDINYRPGYRRHVYSMARMVRSTVPSSQF